MDRQISKQEIKREQRKRIIRWGAGAAVVAAGIAVLFMSLEKGIRRSDLRIAAATEGPLETTVNATGRVVPGYEEIINSPVDTRIIGVFAMAGDSVAEGTPLLQLDLESAETALAKKRNDLDIRRQELTQLRLNNRTNLSDLAMQIEVKEMQVGRLKADVESERRLDSLGSGTGERVRQAETAYVTGTLELKQLREHLANERLRSDAAEEVQRLTVDSYAQDVAQMQRTLAQGRIPAPHSGILTFIANEIGSQVGAGQKVAVVSDLSTFKITGELPESSSDRVEIGSKVMARLGSTELEGTVTNITPQAKGGVISFNVRLDDPTNPRLRSGLRTELYVSYGYKTNVTLIPTGPYFKGPGQYVLFVKDGDGHLARRSVRLGDSNRLFVEVVSGIAPGDSVVTSDMEEFKQSKSLKIK